MLTVALQGGLGNQLFQWAFGQGLAARGLPVQYDVGLFDLDPGRRYMLDKLGLSLPLSRHGGIGQTIHEGTLRYQPDIWERAARAKDAVLRGYWQSERYFADIACQIRDPLRLEDGWSQESIGVAMDIAKHGERACAVHVRRSDNLRPAGIAVHGLLSSPDCRYYPRAMALVASKVPGVHFYVFSDEPDWCREHMAGPGVTIVGHNRPSFTVDAGHDLHWQDGGREVEDLYLMSLCRHAIIANSSFSWWGAWLGDANPAGRVVCAPARWFASRELDATDIGPGRWTKVEVD